MSVHSRYILGDVNSRLHNHQAAQTDGYSGSDLRQLCASAASAPLRELMSKGRDIASIKVDDIPPVAEKHMDEALTRVRSSVQPSELVAYETWNAQFGMSQDSSL